MNDKKFDTLVDRVLGICLMILLPSVTILAVAFMVVAIWELLGA